MNKVEIERHINTLSNTYDNYHFLSNSSKEGRRKMREARRKCEKYILNNPELYTIMVKECDTTFQEEIEIGEFFSDNYFLNDLGEYIAKLKVICANQIL